MSKNGFWLVLLALVTLAGTRVFGQTGTFFKTTYNPAEFNFDNTNYELYQDNRGVMHIANRQGVLHYDANDWRLTAIPYSVYCLAGDDNKIFVGGREGLGYIDNIGKALEEYIPIDTITRDVIGVVVLKNTVYYLTEKKLFYFDKNSPDRRESIATLQLELLELTSVDGKIFLSTNLGLYEVANNEILKINYTPDGVYFVRKSASGKILYLTDSSTIYTQHKGKVERLNFNNQKYLDDHIVTEILWASDSLIAISTLTGGILFVDVPSGKTNQIVNYESGLPDNQILDIYVDNTGSLWAVHNYGLTVISPNIPLRSFNHYPGLKGSLVNVLPFEDQLYVGTSLGVFRLITQKNVKQNVVYDRVRVRIEDNAEEEVVDRKKRRGLFNRKNKEVEEVQSPSYKYIYRKRIIEEELSRSYAFEKIRGINAKCIQLINYNNRLLAGTVQGLYEIQQDTALLLMEIPVLNIYGLPNENVVFVSTADKEVKVIELRSGEWKETNMLDGLRDYIDQISLDPEKNIWLCGADSLYRIQLDRKTLVDVEVYPIENPHFDRVYSTNYDNKILFINSSGYFGYENFQIVRQQAIEDAIGLPKKFIQTADGQLLINTGNNWYGADNNIHASLNFLSFFRDPLAIAKDDSDNYWVTTATNDLYRINLGQVAKLTSDESLFLKEVRNNDVRVPISSMVDIEQEGSQLTFEFASPDYTGIYQKEYRFRLRNKTGTQSPWSPWSSNNNIISYQFLPPGSYTLEANSRNSLGKVLKAEPFTFRIVAPYWKQPWFYVLEVLFFTGLLVFSFYLNHGRGKYVIVSRLLGFLTLVLIVEFFQTVAETYYEANNSPVINFFIQAFIALLILPVESVLRRFLTKEPKTPLAEKVKD